MVPLDERRNQGDQSMSILDKVRLGVKIDARQYDDMLHCHLIKKRIIAIVDEDPWYADIVRQANDICNDKVRAIDYFPSGVDLLLAELMPIGPGIRMYQEIIAPRICISMTMRAQLIEKVGSLMDEAREPYALIAIKGDGVSTNDSGERIK